MSRVSDEEARQCRDNPYNPSGGILVEMAADLLDARARIKVLEVVNDAVFEIIDSLDDPYEGDGTSWQPCTQEQCAGELDRIRAVLVPATDLYLALRENVDLDFVGPHEAVVKGGEE